MKESLSQEALVHVGVWCLGEFGDHLVSGKALGPDNQPIRVTPGVRETMEKRHENNVTGWCGKVIYKHSPPKQHN